MGAGWLDEAYLVLLPKRWGSLELLGCLREMFPGCRKFRVLLKVLKQKHGATEIREGSSEGCQVCVSSGSHNLPSV